MADGKVYEKVYSLDNSESYKDHQSVNDLKVRVRYEALEGWASIVVNLLLFVVKITIGLSIKSVSLIANAVHTLADSGTSAARNSK